MLTDHGSTITDLPTAPTPELLAFQKALAGRYSIERELGRGGMGIVSLAREVALDRPVALKLLPPDVAAQPGVKERFLTEARIAARLSHPNIVQIYSVDEVDGFVFFAMAFVDGGTLGDRLRARGPLSNSEAPRLLREVAWALGHAHMQGVTHRDVKPDNILLDQDSGRAMVTDFGIAVVGEEAHAESQKQVVGTAEFMSPEQAKGSSVDARSDLYSLACVGFYALSGKVPFTADSAAGILVKHVDEFAPTVLSVAPQTPPAIGTALDRCLRKDPDKRFQSGDDLADALGADRGAEKELAVPLRVFIKQTREWESYMAWCGFGLSFAIPTAIAASVEFGAPMAAFYGSIAALVALPIAKLAASARRLLRSGFTQADGTVALLRDIDRKEEEFRFQVGTRTTTIDKVFRWTKILGLSGSAVSLGLGWLTGVDVFFTLFGLSNSVGFFGLLLQELRARGRGDVMGERYLKFWKGKAGTRLFKLAGLGMKRVAPAIAAGSYRATEIVIGLEADRLFEELPKETRESLEGLPETVASLEEDAQALRKQVSELDAILAEIGDDDPSHPSAEERSKVRASVATTRDDAQEKLQAAVAALESIRLGLLYMQAGTGTVESLTMELKAAKELAGDMENLLEGHREVERILDERRKTGVFELVTTAHGER